MQFHYSLFLFLLLLSSHVSAQIQGAFHGGARAQAMGNAYVALTNEAAIWGNIAGLTTLSQNLATLYGSRPFSQSEVDIAGFGFALLTNSGVFSITAQQQGFDDYREQAFGLAYARQLLPTLAIGGRVDIQRFDIAEYGNTQTLTFDLGFRLEMFKGFHLGAHIYSPFEVEVVETSSLESLFGFGASYQVSKKVLLSAALQKHQEYSASIHAGLEYLPAENIFIRLGAQSQPTKVSFGLGYHLPAGLQLDFAGTYHQELGFSPGIGIGYSFGKE